MKTFLSAYALLMLSSSLSLASVTISGISSGGFMAAQMGVIYSSQFSGVGTVAGGFYFCAQNHLQDKQKLAQQWKIYDLSLFQTHFDASKMMEGHPNEAIQLSQNNPMYQAVGICLQNPQKSEIKQGIIEENKTQGLIEAPEQIQAQKIFLYQGSSDTVVNPAMLDKLKEFYRDLKVPDANVKVVQSLGGHNFPTDRPLEKLCTAQAFPYISSCHMDVAGDILKHLSGQPNLVRSADREKNKKNLYRVKQGLPEGSQASRPNSVATYGYLAASNRCLEDPSQCSVHVALHGCEMSDSFDPQFDQRYLKYAKRGYMRMRTKAQMYPLSPLPYIEQRHPRYATLKFAMDSGYLDYVENNNLIVLFPQTWITTENYPLNPKGCWDWYGWTGREYATNQGRETRWLMEWIQQIQKNPKSFIGVDKDGKLTPEPLQFQEAESL